MAAVLLYVCAAFVVWEWHYFDRASAENILCPSACQCLGNMVACSGKELVKVPGDLPSWVDMLDLQDNAISSLQKEDFQGLRSLKWLDLSGNDIKEINDLVFQNLSALETLKLNFNKLTEMPKFGKNTSIIHLHLNHNQIQSLSADAIATMPNLQTLDLNYNQIMDIPVGAFPAGSKLQSLLLNNNHIIMLEKGCLENLTSLQSLKLNKNKLFELDKKVFHNLTNLRYLEMMRNRLQKVEGLTFDGLKNLQVLKLKRNSISKLMDGAFWGLENIQNLQLDHNNISVVAKGWLYGLTKLRHLSLAHNNIQMIEPEGWKFCRDLDKLDLTHNKITTIAEKTFAQLSSLKDLFLNHNHVSRIDDGAFLDLGALLTLEMNNNEISWTIEDVNGAFSGLNNLNKLGLKTNRIKSIANHAFTGLRELRELHLEDNAITSIQENSFGDMQALQELRFNSTNLLCDCKIAWLPTWLKKYNFHQSVSAVCAHPEALKTKSIFDIPIQDFKCSDVEFPKPIIVEHPQTQIALKGDNVTLFCTAVITGDSTPQFQWKKDNTVLKNAIVENLASSNGEVKHYTTKLHLHNVQDAATGRYQCVISSVFGPTYSQRAKISVHVFPAFLKTPVDVTVKAGKTAKLECSATGQPSPTIAWQKDGGDDFPAARERRMHIMPTDDVFFIVNTKSSDEGIYSCTATNDAGTIIANATVRVLETPSFTRTMVEKKSSREGETTVLECMASGSPKPKLEWLKDNQPLDVTPRHFFTADNQLLIIVQTEHSDAGIYTCKMTNTLGAQKGKTKLTVLTAEGQINDGSSGGGIRLDDESTTTGIIIIAVVCCVVGTSLVWVIIIYQTRKRHELYSATPTDETTLPGEVPSSGYTSSDREGSFTQALTATQGYQFQDYQMKESGYDTSSGRFRPSGMTRPPAIFPSDVDEDDQQQSVSLTLGEHKTGRHSGGNSISSLNYPHSETDTISSSHSTSSTHTSGHLTLQTFHPHRTNHDRCPHAAEPQDKCEHCVSSRLAAVSVTPGVGESDSFEPISLAASALAVSMPKSPSISSLHSSRSTHSVGCPAAAAEDVCAKHRHPSSSAAPCSGKALKHHPDCRQRGVDSPSVLSSNVSPPPPYLYPTGHAQDSQHLYPCVPASSSYSPTSGQCGDTTQAVIPMSHRHHHHHHHHPHSSGRRKKDKPGVV